MKPSLLAAAITLCAALCTGCAAGLLDTKQPEQQTYVISAAAAQAADGEADRSAVLPVHLAVSRPILGPGLYTDRIAVLHADRRLDYYAASRWGETVDVMLQSLLAESLRNTGRLAGVQSDVSAFAARYLLQIEVRDFQAEYTTEGEVPLVRVNFVCTLGRIRAREPLEQYAAGAAVRAADNTMAAVIVAFEEAYRQAAQVAVERTLSTLAMAKQAADAADAADTHEPEAR
jgi:cholesterol transport system auxiliary component